MKIATFVGTRPEIIKLSRVLPALDQAFEHALAHTGQNPDYELRDIFFEQMGLRKPDVQAVIGSGSASHKTADMLRFADDILAHIQPDAVLILGDTNSAVAAAYAAKRRHIPVFHMEAGNRCFDARVPEEINRKIVDHLADINMPYTEHARRNLLAEGLHPSRIIKTGSPMREVLRHYGNQIDRSDILQRLSVSKQGYFVVSAHREENVDDPRRLEELITSIHLLAESAPVVVSVHPRTANRWGGLPFFPDNVKLCKPFGFFDYITLQQNARCVISDSGTLTEEAAILGFPAVAIREAHERPEGDDEGTTVLASLLDPARVVAAVELAIRQRVGVFYTPLDYESDNVAAKVVRIIASYA